MIKAVTPSQASVVGIIKQAAATTGADFDYLLRTAEREASLDPKAKAASSSASGLFQFIDQTWLGAVKTHGAELGFSKEAALIEKTPKGYRVTDDQKRTEVLNLRFDPKASALIAGAHAEADRGALEQALGRKVNQGELYIAHFLGRQGAIKFLAAEAQFGDRAASELFPRAARANAAIFKRADGAYRSLSEVKSELEHLHHVPIEQGHSVATREPLKANPDTAASKAVSFALHAVQSIDLVPAETKAATPGGEIISVNRIAFLPSDSLSLLNGEDAGERGEDVRNFATLASFYVDRYKAQQGIHQLGSG